MHDALRRDLSRISIELASAPAAHARQEALAEHLEWMMSFLHVHHSNEDEKLWPLVRVRRPAASVLLDQMDADHRVIGPHIEAVQAAARRWADTGDVAAADTLSSAVLGLQLVLLPHLDREEREVMPIVSEVFTEAQWQEWGRKAKPRCRWL